MPVRPRTQFPFDLRAGAVHENQADPQAREQRDVTEEQSVDVVTRADLAGDDDDEGAPMVHMNGMGGPTARDEGLAGRPVPSPAGEALLVTERG